MSSLLKVIAVTAFGLFVGQMCGCASTNLVNVWHNPALQASPLHKMLVIAIRKDGTKRRIWEDAFSGELAKHGVAATSSYSLFPDTVPDTGQIITTVQGNNFDGILVVRKLPTEKDMQYVRPYTSTELSTNYSYWDIYRTYYTVIEHPGYIDSQTVGIHAIDVTDTRNGGRLIWSATSRTPEPVSAIDAQRSIVGLVMSDLTKGSIIGAKK